MTAVILTIHTIIVLGLIVVVLLQRSEGGALGMGSGGGGGFMSGRGAANALTRTTSILAALFFATSLGLAVYSGGGEDDDTVVEELTDQAVPEVDAEITAPSTEDLLGAVGVDGSTTDSPSDNSDVPLSESEILDALGNASDDVEQQLDALEDVNPADILTTEPTTGDDSEPETDTSDDTDE